MSSKYKFLMRSADSAQALGLGSDFSLFHGESIDPRGELAIDFEKMNLNRVRVIYDVEKMALNINGECIDADVCDTVFSKYDKNISIVLEATTLGFAELFLAIRSLIYVGHKRVEIVYVEPLDYSREKSGNGEFSLSDLITGFHPIPHAVVDLNDDELESGVFFLGFESERLERAISEHQMLISKDIKVVFGIPAFQPGWELNSIVPHLQILKENRLDIAYCAANDPEAALECLETTRLALGNGKRMFVAPIGTKPCGVAAAIFASIHQNQVGLLFDHPKKKNKRSKGASIWHRYSLILSE